MKPSIFFAVLIVSFAAAGPSAAQGPAPPNGARPGEVETAPIRCWWKTDTTEVRIGERFTVTLTCGVIETSSLKVVAGTNQLDPGALQLTPFEVVSGVRREDIVARPWRYLQYPYRVRLMSEGFFGQEISLPALPVTYNIQAAAGRGAQGRDQSYILPPLRVRVASLVPKDASDIRDASGQGFDAVATRRFRASTANVIGGILLGFAGVLVVLAGVRATGKVRQRRSDAIRPLSPVTVLGGCLGGLTEVKATVARDGWSPALARQALAMLRIASAVSLGRPVTQAIVPRDKKEREGQLVLRQGLIRRKRAMVSAATTAHTIDRELSNGHAPSPATRAAIGQLRGGLDIFSVAGYGREGGMDTIALDSALAEGTAAVKQLRLRSFWPFGGAASLRTVAPGLRSPSMSEERL